MNEYFRQIDSPRITADTMLFYYLGSGHLKKRDIVSSTESLWATPINVLELLSNLETDNWLERKKAARAILDNSMIAPDPNEHFISITEGRLPLETDTYYNLCTILAESTSFTQLKENIDIDASAEEKLKYYERFANKAISMCDKFVPGYAKKVRRNKKPPVMNQDLQKKFWETISSQLLLELYTDGILDVDGGKRASDAFSDYIAIYRGYIMRLLTEQLKPQPNDWGDLELFKYLQPGHYVATSEERWRKVAEKAEIAHRVRWIKPK